MITIAHRFTRVLAAAALLGTALMATPAEVAAGSQQPPRGIWLADVGTKGAEGSDWGRLVLEDGVLTFASPKTDWRIEMSQIKRAAVQPVDRLVLESVSGETFYVMILDARMQASSPRPALKILQRALQASIARRER